MNPQREEDLQHRLQQLEAEIHSPSEVVPQSQQKIQSSQSGFSTFNSLRGRISSWFNRLSGIGKLVVLGVAALFGFAILQFVFKLIATVISLALLALLVYLGYKFFVSSTARQK